MIVIISTMADIATDAVVDRLNKSNVTFVRINTEDVPSEVSFGVDLCGGILHAGRYEAEIKKIRSVWFRRIRNPDLPLTVDKGIAQYITNETHTTIKGLIACLPPEIRWMSHPKAIDLAELKPFQLQTAQAVGFQIPPTIITSDPDRIVRFLVAQHGFCIAKPVRSGYVQANEQAYGIFTHRINHDDVERLNSSLPCPIIVQAEIEKSFDIRVTYVDGHLFSAAIDSQSDPDAIVDWRRTSNPLLPHERVELPEEISERIIRYMKCVNLSYGALDFVMDKHGRYIFLEVNPSGQWLWLEDQLGFPIADTIAGWLSR